MKVGVEEITSLKEFFEKPTKPNSLLVFDLDQTLMCAPDYEGSEGWYYEQIQEKCARGISLEDAVAAANEAWEQAHGRIQPVLTETDTVQWLSAWNEKGRSIGLTARAPSFIQRTCEQLDFLGLRFTGISQAHEGLAHYRDGVLYSGPLGKKGHVLSEFLEPYCEQFSSVFFVDDRHEHVISVKQAMDQMGLECWGVRYVFSRPAIGKKG